MKVSFRVDCSKNVGLGHSIRCFSLAQHLISDNHEVQWIAAECTQFFQSTLEEFNIPLINLDSDRGTRQDASKTIQYLTDFQSDAIVLDGYCFDRSYQNEISNAKVISCLLDDYGQIGFSTTDLLVDQNVGTSSEYYTNGDGETTYLLGTSYVLLRDQFTNHQVTTKLPGTPQNLLVTAGGAGTEKRYKKILMMLPQEQLIKNDITVKVLTGDEKTHETLQRLIHKFDYNLNLEGPKSNMVEPFRWADFAITAASSTCYELAYLNTPMLSIEFSDNQRLLSEELASFGASVNLGKIEDLTDQQLSDALTQMINDRDKFESMYQCCKNLVDGMGKNRITAKLNDLINNN